jgi:hypothetical protein
MIRTEHPGVPAYIILGWREVLGGILQGNQQLVACCITFFILLKTSNNILIFVNQHRFIL